jgi:hypothetical protein
MGATTAMKSVKKAGTNAMKVMKVVKPRVVKTKAMKAMKTKVMKAMKTKAMKAMKSMKKKRAETHHTGPAHRTTRAELMLEYVDYMLWQAGYGVQFVSWYV